MKKLFLIVLLFIGCNKLTYPWYSETLEDALKNNPDNKIENTHKTNMIDSTIIDEILESLDRATVVAEGFIPVKIVLSDNETLNITTVNKDIGGGNEEVSVKTLGVELGDISGFEMSFNPNYFMQGIEVLDGETVYIRFSGNEKPVVIQGEVENYKYLLMPVRTN